MKILINFLIFGFSLSLYSQSSFSKGYNDGYKEGYCYDKTIGCIAPNPPMTPMTKINESIYSYKDGYNRGFLDGKKKSPITSPYGRKSYTPEYKPFKPDFEQLQRILRERQQQVNNNYSRSYSSNNKKITLYDYLTGTLFPDNLNLKKLSPNLSGYNSQTRYAIKAKQQYYSFRTYPIIIVEGEYRACAIVFDSNRNVEFVDNNAYVNIGSDRSVEMIFFDEPYSKTHTPIFKYDDSVKEGMARTMEDNDTRAKNFTWNLISFQEKSKHCLSEILVQPFSNNLVKKGEEYSVLLLFNDFLQKSNNSK